MMRLPIFALAFGLLFQNPPAPPAQFPPLGHGLSVIDKAALQLKVDQLAARVAALKRRHRASPMADRVADVEVYLDAVRRPLKYDERLYSPKNSTPLEYALQTIATGVERADLLAKGETPWMTQSGVRGFYSRIDGSAQPYILTVPDAYDPAARQEYRLDIFMHGRDDQVLEQQFMTKSTSGYTSKPLRAGADRFMLQPYGRYSNASRFAGETDGLEAIASVMKAYPIDRNRLVMSGFSMGGASAWSYIVHFADRWAASAPGAGFTETEVFLRGGLARQPQNGVQRTLWHMYDSTDYAINTFNVPVVAYSGEIDPQKQAADAMAAAMAAEGLTLEHIIGPKTAHAYEPAARQQLQDRIDQIVMKGRNPAPSEIRFTTWMLRYNKMFWITVDAMDQEWERARVNAKIDGGAISITTTNVNALHVDPALAPFAPGTRVVATIDGTRLTLPAVGSDTSLRTGFVKANGTWRVGELPSSALRKRNGLQGPIDDAFMDAFVFVRPTGKPLSERLGTWEKEQADYAISEWVHFFRGEPRVKNDVEIEPDDIANNNIALFGDPSSNAVYKRIASRLPIAWTREGVVVGGERFDANHAPVFIFPNPLNPRKYVVINSGFTFHDQSNNDMQSPKLPDWAMVDITKPGNNYKYLPLFVESQGFFDEFWKLKVPSKPVSGAGPVAGQPHEVLANEGSDPCSSGSDPSFAPRLAGRPRIGFEASCIRGAK
jgi:dienelactone hydrolase